MQAATLVVDDFSSVGTPPSATNNSWNEGSLTGVLGGAREQTKSGSGANGDRVWSNTPSGTLSLTTTATTNVWNLVYDGTSNGTLTNTFNPNVDVYAFTTLDLAVTQTAATPGDILLTLFTKNPVNPALSWSATQTRTMPSGSGTVSFDLGQLTGLYNPVELQRIILKFQNFGPGKITLDNLAFNGQDPSAVPEPTTLALASCGLVALVALRRRKR